jgi:L-lactate dehydrogenase complex protein LldF
MELTSNQFMHSATIAVKDIQLQTALSRATNNVTRNRNTAMSELADAEAIRQQGRGAKLRALHDLPDLLEQMERNVTERGGNVLWAEDSEEAVRHILNICKIHNLKRGVKSKSMVTEEIGLLPALEAIGVEMVETDLGEFIVQVDESHPSHIVMPVMHMTREQVRDLFIDKLDMPYTDKASDSTVAIVTNEGNGRLSTGLPRAHIAVVGIEKIVPTWEDFITLVQLLPRNGTGQRMTVYVNMFNGPAREGEGDGPEHFYLILVDNGRSAAYASEYAESLACIRCGACANVCPVYQSVGGHAYGWVYSGPIGAVYTPVSKGKENASYLPFASSLCGACKQVCPVDINIPDMLLKLRRDLQSQQEPVWQLGMKAWRFGFQHPLLYQIGGKAASLATRTLAGQAGKLDALPYPLDGWTDKRDFPAFPAQSFRDWWKQNRGDK